MATPQHHPTTTIGSLLLGGGGEGPPGGDGFRLWPIFSVASFRRRIIEVLACGGASGARGREHPRFEFGSPVAAEGAKAEEELRDGGVRNNRGSELLGELLRAEASSESGSEDAEEETRRKVEALEEMQGVVKRLQCQGDNEEEEEEWKEAAGIVRQLAKDDPEARETLAMLGAIPPLVGMLDSGDTGVQISALYALLNLGIGNGMNKAAIVKAGAVHKMLRLMEPGCPPAVSDAVVANFLGLSAHDSNKPVIGSSGAIPFLLAAFKSPPGPNSQARQDGLRALYNLSIDASNAPLLVDAGLVPAFLSVIGDMDVTDRVLSVLSNLVATPEGRRAVSRNSSAAFPALVDVLYWTDAPPCQESAVYVLMVMAHKGYSDRAAMVEAGAVSALLELTLLGTAIAQRRASRILEFLAVDKGKQQVSGVFEAGGCSAAVPVSAPQCGCQASDDAKNGTVLSVATEGGCHCGTTGMSEENKAVKQLVQQSLQCGLRRIVKRANLPQEFEPSDHLRTLTASSTSKSLPF